MNICVYGASSDKIGSTYLEAGEKLGQMIAKNGDTLVFGGGAGGMMGAVARGCTAGGGKILGITPSFFNVDGVLYDKCTELIYTETMSERKNLLISKSDSFIITPGGIGTFDELFETLTMRQLGAHEKPLAIYNIDGYYDNIVAMMETAIEQNFIYSANRCLYFISDNAYKIIEYLNNYTADDIPPAEFRGAK